MLSAKSVSNMNRSNDDMPIFGSTLAMSRQATVIIRSRRDVGSGCVRGAHYQRYYVSLSLFYV